MIVSNNSPNVKVTYWLTEDGQIETYHEASDANGVYAFTDSPPDDPKKILDSEAITRIFRKRAQEDEKRWDQDQAVAQATADNRAAARQKGVDDLVAAGLTPEAAEILVPKVAPFRPSTYRPPIDVASNLRSYGLNDEQVRRVIGGWV